MKHLTLCLLAALLICGCQRKTIVDDQRTFANDVWNRFTPEKFDANITNPDDYFNIDLSLTIDTAVFRYNKMPLTVNIYSPDGERRMFYSNISLKENGRWRGEMAEGNYRTFNQRIRSLFSFNKKGTYSIEIGQATSQYDLEGAHSITLYIQRTQIDYSEL